MTTNDEISALVARFHSWPEWLKSPFNADCITAIETLLAREAEVIKAIDKLPTVSPIPHNDVIIYNWLRGIRAILYPTETPK